MEYAKNSILKQSEFWLYLRCLQMSSLEFLHMEYISTQDETSSGDTPLMEYNLLEAS